MTAVLDHPSKVEQRLASDSLPSYMESLRSTTKKKSVTIVIDGVEVQLPQIAMKVLGKIISYIAQGKAISIAPADSELTTQQAADILNVSRPHLVKLVEEGEIPHVKVGKHRRVKLTDIMAYRETRKKVRREALGELQKLGQKMGT